MVFWEALKTVIYPQKTQKARNGVSRYFAAGRKLKLQIVIKWVNEPVTLLIYFRAFRIFRGLAAFLGW